MLNYAINNETARGLSLLPFLTFHPSEKEMSVMAKNSIPQHIPELHEKLTVGDVFGRLTVIGPAVDYITRKGDNYPRAKCLCDCGRETDVIVYSLLNKETKSCGCLHKDAVTKHSLCDHRVYILWGSMKDRCRHENATGYKYYGGRGISVCEEWRHDFIPFYKWALCHGWERGLQLDRIDNDGDYSPSNCQFITPAENSRKKPSTKLSLKLAKEIRDLKKSNPDMPNGVIASIYGVHRTTINSVIYNHTWRSL
jgi:hypothetical protein